MSCGCKAFDWNDARSDGEPASGGPGVFPGDIKGCFHVYARGKSTPPLPTVAV